jgi:hypothetical protein
LSLPERGAAEALWPPPTVQVAARITGTDSFLLGRLRNNMKLLKREMLNDE